MSVKVDVEYCGKCNFKWECEELLRTVKRQVPDADVNCHVGRRGSFEVRINDVLVHSKLSKIAFPNKEDVANMAKDASEGKQVVGSATEDPITDCVIQ